MSAPRIDTLLNTLDAVAVLLREVRPHLVDVHDLAQNRARAVDERERHGRTQDYALDNHGDPKAREVYVAVAVGLVELGRETEKDLKVLRKFLNKGTRSRRLASTTEVTAAEFDQAFTARQQRKDRGEHHPLPLVAQPERKHHRDPSMELDTLRAAVRRLAASLDENHRDCETTGPNGSRRRKPRWLDRTRLTPAQSDALDRALQTEEAVA